MTYAELVAKVKAKAIDRADKSCRLMYQRIADMRLKYIEGWNLVIAEANEKADSFGIGGDDDENRARVLEMVLAAHGISLDDPAPKTHEGTGTTDDGTVAGATAEQDSGDPHGGGGPRGRAGEGAGGQPDGQQTNGIGHEVGGKRPRRAARRE